ncbi:protein FAM221A-like [Tubulanus polymorphus]|uniref:protein FAM221A-like n=1 Tax=Tubulanus polymorphus TaxID=672921 RepID=UPI003DA6B46A
MSGRPAGRSGRGGASGGRGGSAGPPPPDDLPQQYNLQFGKQGGLSAGAHVDAYLEYRRIVGDDDGGVLFSPDEYEDYKKRVIPQRMKNRIFVSWSNPAGMDCKMIGPETPCFCTHRFKQHKTDFQVIPDERPIKLPCKVKGCMCGSYNYVPLNGSQPIRCQCKHYSDDHTEVLPLKCRKSTCRCLGFKSSYTCGCGEPTYKHKTLPETKDERVARGHPIGYDVPYQAMGGLTGFSSLADGYMRLDPSGVGMADKDFLEQSITSKDHPFLRGNVEAIYQSKQRGADQGIMKLGDDEDLAERMSAMRRPDETDMDYFERRYQERQKASSVYKGPKVKPAIRQAPPSGGRKK